MMFFLIRNTVQLTDLRNMLYISALDQLEKEILPQSGLEERKRIIVDLFSSRRAFAAFINLVQWINLVSKSK